MASRTSADGGESPTCVACQGTHLRRHPASRRTGNVIWECRDCGARFIADRPTREALEPLLDADRDTFADWTSRTRTQVIDDSHATVLDELNTIVGARPGRSLFDVGAGAGNFLSMARDAGFAPHGNDLATGAIELAAERYGIDLLLGDLSTIADPGEHDALTMWCVLAHVPDADSLLTEAMRTLRPGGVLFLQTPRWSFMDRLGMLALDLTRGRAARIMDRRLALHHMVLHTETSMRRALERLGYEVQTVRAVVRFSLTTVDYLRSLGVPERVRPGIARVIDFFLDRGLFPRNVLDVYARRPLDQLEQH